MGGGLTTITKNPTVTIVSSAAPQRRMKKEWESWETVKDAWRFPIRKGPDEAADTDFLSWHFNIWQLTYDDYVTLSMLILLKFDLPNKFGIDPRHWCEFMAEIERLMTLNVNPYHSYTHVIDVLQSVGVILHEYGGAAWLTDLDIYSLLLSAIVHDLEHPGTNNLYQINSGSPLAIRYNDIAVLESYHVARASEVLQQLHYSIFQGLSLEQRKYVRKVMISTVLSTDMTTHFTLKDEVDGFSARVMQDPSKFPLGADGKREQVAEKERMMLMKSFLHVADISNPAKPWTLSKKWSDQVTDEFFAQGDLEKKQNLPVSMNCDRTTTNQDELSINFTDFIVAPFFFLLTKILPPALQACKLLESNRVTWNNLLTQRLSAARGALGDPAKVDDLINKWELRAAAFTEKIRVLEVDSTRVRSEYDVEHPETASLQTTFAPQFDFANRIAESFSRLRSERNMQRLEDTSTPLAIGLAIVGYSLCSSTLLLANKMVMQYLPFPSVVSFIQILFTTVAILTYKMLGGQVDAIEWPKVKAYALYIVAFVSAIYANMKALQHSNVETVIVFRACSPIAVTVVEYLLMDRALPSARSSIALLVVAFGAVLYCTSDSQFALSGISAYYWVIAYFFLITFEMTYGKKLTDSVKMESVWAPVLYCNLLSAVPMFLLGYVNGDYENISEHLSEMAAPGAYLLLFSCIVGTLIGYTGWLCRSMVSATTYTLVGVVNKFFTVLLNVVVWDKHSSPFGLFAVCLCLLAGTLYQQAPKRDEVRKDTQLPR